MCEYATTERSLVELIWFRSWDRNFPNPPAAYSTASVSPQVHCICPSHGTHTLYALVLGLSRLQHHVDVSPLPVLSGPLHPFPWCSNSSMIRSHACPRIWRLYVMNIDNVMAGVNQQVAGLANFRAQTDKHLQNITADLTRQNWLQSAALLPNPFSGHTGQNAQRFIDEINQYADYTTTDNIGKCRLFPLLLWNRASACFSTLQDATVDNWANRSAAFLRKYGPSCPQSTSGEPAPRSTPGAQWVCRGLLSRHA